MNLSSTPAATSSALRIESFDCGPFHTNCYLLLDPVSRDFVVIDPAIQSDAAYQTAQKWTRDGCKLTQIWNTHGHLDHIYDNSRWKAEFGAPILAHDADIFFLEHAREQAIWFGLPLPEVVFPDQALSEAQTLHIGAHAASVIELPGHSPGSVGFDFGDFIVSGDVLFHNSVGRTDLPGGNPEILAQSLRRLLHFPIQTTILPGHGPQTTIEAEKRDNPFARL